MIMWSCQQARSQCTVHGIMGTHNVLNQSHHDHRNRTMRRHSLTPAHQIDQNVVMSPQNIGLKLLASRTNLEISGLVLLARVR